MPLPLPPPGYVLPRQPLSLLGCCFLPGRPGCFFTVMVFLPILVAPRHDTCPHAKNLA